MTIRIINGSAALVCCFVLLAACSDSDGGGGSGEVDFPVDSDKALKDLSESEARDICEAGLDAVANHAIADSVCALQGLIGTATGADCEEGKAACEKQMFDTDTCDDDSAASRASCDATVGEVEDCVNDMFDAVKDLVPKITCDMTIEQLSELDFEMTDLSAVSPASCEALSEKCPDYDFSLGPLGS